MNKTESLTTLQDALIIGCDFKIGHDAIAPYTYGYYVTSEYVKKISVKLSHVMTTGFQLYLRSYTTIYSKMVGQTKTF